MPRFHFQGALRDDALYIERSADVLLPPALARGDLCFVLGPRQIGKSSLRHRVARRLTEEGIASVHIDLNNIGTEDASAERWYYSLARIIARDLQISNPVQTWQETPLLTPEQRFDRFLREQVAIPRESPVVIFIDEIDVLLKLPFSRDSFFALLRSLCDARASDPVMNRLTFCLLGVTTITALISDPVRTPFNIGFRVFLEDFTPEEARGFLPGLQGLDVEPEELLAEVLRWTEGHPYMTQRLCAALADRQITEPMPARARVEQVVQEMYLLHGRDEDFNLANAARCLSQDTYFGAPREQLLRLYRRILRQGPVPVIGEDAVQRALRLTGICAERSLDGQRRLCARNRIFATVFDNGWLNTQEEERLMARALLEWQANGRQDAYVLHGAALDRALAWARDRADIQPEEAELLLASQRVSEREAELRLRAQRAEQAERLAAESRQLARSRLILVGVGSIALVVALIFAGLSISQYIQVRAELRAAQSSRDQAQASLDEAKALVVKREKEIEQRSKEKGEQIAQELTADLNRRTLASERGRTEAEQKKQVAEQARHDAELRAEAADRLATEASKKQREAEQRRREAEERLASYQNKVQGDL